MTDALRADGLAAAGMVPAAADPNPELRRILAGLALIALAVSFLFAPEGLPGIEICHFKRLTGLPCPGCGLTHSFCAISHGQFAAAWAHQPFGFVLYLGAVAAAMGPLLIRVLPRAAWFYRSRVVLAALVVVGSAMIVYDGWRIARCLW